MASKREELEARLIALDQASKPIDAVADKLAKLDGTEADVTISADDKATAEVKALMTKIDGLTDDEKKVILSAESRKLKSEVDGALKLLGKVDGENFQAILDVKDQAAAKLAAVDAELTDIDGRTASATVDADKGAGLTRAEGDLKTIDGGTYKATIDANEGAGLSSILGDIDGVPGRLTEGMNILSTGAGKAGAIGAAIGAFSALVQQATDWGTEVGEVAQLTGDSTENVSGFLSIWKGAGFEKGDLLDIVAQMVGVLATSPGIATQLGIDLAATAGKPMDTLKAAIEALSSDQLSANDRILIGSQLFGEEGVRQINALVAMIDGDLDGAIEAVPEALILSPEQVEQAQEMRRHFSAIQTTVQGLIVNMGEGLLPAVDAVVAKLDELGLIEDLTAPPVLQPGDVAGGAQQIMAQELLAHAYDVTTGTWGDYIAQAGNVVTATEELDDAGDDHIANLDAQIDALEESADAYDTLTDALNEQGDAYRLLADAQGEYDDAVEDAADKLVEYNDAVAEHGELSEEAVDLLEDLVDSYQAVADANVETARQTAATTGRTLSQREALDIMNSSLLASAASMEGPARTAILNRIRDLNQIPPSVLTKIEAAIEAGDLEEAQRLLNEASAPRKAYMLAELTAASAADVRAKANALASARTIAFYGSAHFQAIWDAISAIRSAVTNLSFGGFHWQHGTEFAPAGYAWVGEAGPELMRMSGGEQVIPHDRSRQLAAKAGGDGGGNTYISIRLPQGTTDRSTRALLDQYERRQGPRLPGE